MYTKEGDKKLIIAFLIFGGIHLLIALFSPFSANAEDGFVEFDKLIDSAFFIMGVFAALLCALWLEDL